MKNECYTGRLWTVPEVAWKLGIHEDTLRKRARAKEITFIKVFGQYRFRLRDIASMIGRDEAAELFAEPSMDADGATRPEKE